MVRFSGAGGKLASTGGVSVARGGLARSLAEPVDLRWLPALVVAALTAIAAALRIAGIDQSLFADELSSWWIVSTNDVRGVISSVHSNDEITPPLYFLAAALTSKIDPTIAMLRLPSLLAGIATVPLVYEIGRRTIGRFGGLVAAALVTVSPFMVYYSTEARSYALLMCLTALSTVAMLVSLDTRRARWWVLYALASAGVVYTHYTGVFVLVGQLVWLLWAHPEARRAAILANLGALVLFLPWTTGAINDFTSPTGNVLSALTDFTVHGAWVSLRSWLIGYAYSVVPPSMLPGTTALIMLGVGAVGAAAAAALRSWRGLAPSWPERIDSRMTLVAVLAVSVPAGEALYSLAGANIFGGRNLAASTPGLALLIAALLAAPGPGLRLVAAVLAVAALAIGTAKQLGPRYQRPDVGAAVRWVEHLASPRDVIIDETAELSPGPLDSLDAELERDLRVVRVDAPAQRGHPFNIFDHPVAPGDAIKRAMAAAHGARIFVVEYRPNPNLRRRRIAAFGAEGARPLRPADSYKLVAAAHFPGLSDVRAREYAIRPRP